MKKISLVMIFLIFLPTFCTLSVGRDETPQKTAEKTPNAAGEIYDGYEWTHQMEGGLYSQSNFHFEDAPRSNSLLELSQGPMFGSSISKTNDSMTNENGSGHKEQVEIIEHKITNPELEKLIQKIGVRTDDKNYNQIINGHGTGLHPPTHNEWAEIADKGHLVERVLLENTIQSPSSVDHTSEPWFPPTGNQDGEGSCTAWAVAYYMKTFQEAKEHGWDLSGAEWVGGYSGSPTTSYQDRIFSPDFVYHLINRGTDQGSSFYSAINLVCGIGASSWEKMPYNPSDSSSWPSEDAWREASLYRGNSSGYEYMWLKTDDDLISLKNWIASDHLALIAVDASQYSSLTSADVWTLDGYVSPIVNHANTIVGYDDSRAYVEEGLLRQGAFKIANSWGEGGWENVADGCYWISYEAMKQRVGICMFYHDRINYIPKLSSSFRMDHSKRGECDIVIGVGNHSNPAAEKSFTSLVGGGDFPFCSNNIVFDITELKERVSTVYNQSFFMRVNDGGSVSTGTILDFSIQYAISEDPPIATVNGDYVFADVVLPNTIRVPLHFNTIQEAVNAVVLGIDEDPRVTIRVSPGIYNEHLIVNKTVSLIGENQITTIVDGSSVGNVIEVIMDNVSLMGFTIRNSGAEWLSGGITLGYIKNCNVSRNNITNNYCGIYAYSSTNNSISWNNITDNGCGILLGYSSNSLLHHNSLDGNGDGFGVVGYQLSHYLHSIDTSNLVEGKPVYYFISQHDLTVNSSTHPEIGFLALINSTDITVDGLRLTKNKQGLLMAYTNNTEIQNNNITNNDDGVWLIKSSNNSLTGNNITNRNTGIYLDYFSNHNTISGNNIVNNDCGINLYDSSYNTISANYIANNRNGFTFLGSSRNSVFDNQITDNTEYGMELWAFSCNTISGNNITGNTWGICLRQSQDNMISGNNITNNTWGIQVRDSSYNTLARNNIANNDDYGVWLFYSPDNTLSGNTVRANNNDGIYLYWSSYNTICGNDITANFNIGVSLESSSNNSLQGNNITNNNGSGICVWYESASNIVSGNIITANGGTGIRFFASGGTVFGNHISNNGAGISATFYSTLGDIYGNNITANGGDGISLFDYCSASGIYGNNITANGGDGISLFASGGGSIYGNNMADNDWGIWLDEASGQIFENTITNNDRGIYATYWCTAKVYHNNFINNTQQFDFVGWGGAVLWDDGYPSGGNYWSDYNGTDMFRGPYQNETGSDEIGDTPYVINEYNQDEYPLMKGIHEIGITAVTTSKTVVGQGYNLNITVTILNYGVCADSRNITFYANTTTIASQNVVLTSRNSTTVTFTWDTRGFAKGNYTISAIATIVPDEIDTDDNTYSDGTVMVTIPGDVNGDGLVDMEDMFIVVSVFGARPEDQEWDPRADITCIYGLVDWADVLMVNNNFGSTVD